MEQQVMSDGISLSVIPIATFWAAFNSLFRAAEFVNGIRDTVIIGKKDNVILSESLRNAMLFDWVLSMVGAIALSLLFAAVIIWMGFYILNMSETSQIAYALWMIGSAPILGAVLFVCCGISDFRAMRQAIQIKNTI